MKLINYLKIAIDFMFESNILVAYLAAGSVIIPMSYAAKISIENQNQKAACERKIK